MAVDVLVAGSINTDLVVRCPRAPEAGETVTATSFATFPGGKGANQAVAAARAGARVAMLGATGDDRFGADRRADLERDGIGTEHVLEIPGASSGVALITVEEGGENRIAYVPGATSAIPAGHAIGALRSTAPRILLATLELPDNALRALFDAAKASGATVVCNATPEPGTGRDLALMADLLVVNETEAVELLGSESGSGWDDTARQLAAYGPSTVVITLGSAGAVVCERGRTFSIPAPDVEVVDTTAAGDAFCGACAAELARGASVEAAVRFGVRGGSLAVTREGAQPSIATRREIEAIG